MSDCRFGVSPVNFPDPELPKYVTNIIGINTDSKNK